MGIKKSRTDVLLNFDLGSGGRIRTDDLRVMSPTSYHCSTPHSLISLAEIGCKGTNFFPIYQIILKYISLFFDYSFVINTLGGTHLDSVDACRQGLEADFAITAGQSGTYHCAPHSIKEIDLYSTFVAPLQIDFASGGIGPEAEVIIAGRSDAKVAVDPDGIEGGIDRQTVGLSGTVDVTIAVGIAAPAAEAEVGVGVHEGALGHQDAVGGAVLLAEEVAFGAIGTEAEALVVEAGEVEEEDGVEVAQLSVASGVGQGEAVEFILAITDTEGVVDMDGVKDFFARLDTEDGTLVEIEGIGGVAAGAAAAGCEVVHGVVAIAIAAPTPIEVVHGVEI